MRRNSSFGNSKLGQELPSEIDRSQYDLFPFLQIGKPMKRILIILSFALLTHFSTCLHGQQSELITATVSANADCPYANLHAIIHILEENNVSELSFKISETENISVRIQTNKSVDSLRQLVKSLEDKGVDVAGVFPLPIAWMDFSFKRLESVRLDQGAIVFIRADWCTSCEYMDKKTFIDSNLRRQISDSGIPFLMADITQRTHGEDAKLLASRFAKNSVPTFLFFPKNSSDEPIVAHDLIEPAQISEFIQNNKANK